MGLDFCYGFGDGFDGHTSLEHLFENQELYVDGHAMGARFRERYILNLTKEE